MKYYIADTHLCHANIIRLDKRPFKDVDEMEREIIARQNARVQKSDEVYILGDFCWKTADDWRRILPKLNGKKFLIKGNHDLNHMPTDIRNMFEGPVMGIKEIKDGDRTVIMSHYPLLSYKHDYDENVYMLYGHVHCTMEFDAIKEAVKTVTAVNHKAGYDYKGQLYNCWCGYLNYAPATLDEIINNPLTH